MQITCCDRQTLNDFTRSLAAQTFLKKKEIAYTLFTFSPEEYM